MAPRPLRLWLLPHFDAAIFDVDGDHRNHSIIRRVESAVFRPDRYNQSSCALNSSCFNPKCRARYPINEVIYNCPRCGALLKTDYPDWEYDPTELKRLWRERRMSNSKLDQSGVWRYRECIPFLDD